MRLIILDFARILIGVALISSQIGMVQASQVQQKGPQIVLPEAQATGSKDPKYGQCYTKTEYNAKYNDAVRAFSAKGGSRLKTVTDEYFNNNKRVPCK